MPQPKTVAQARLLPEVTLDESEWYAIGQEEIEQDTICGFVDLDRKFKHVVCVRREVNGPDEWVKLKS